MRVADYVIRFLEERGIGHAFTVAGGGSAFLNDALAGARGMKYICCHHEQAAAMAAEAYARVRTGFGLAVVTSGPGATNAITGVEGAWLDHVPTVTISGQVFSTQTIRGSGLRQKGIQEVDIIRKVEGSTKHAAVVREPAAIRFHLEKAMHLATSGRPGPVWLDIPADVQKAEIDPGKLGGFTPPEVAPRQGLPEAVAKVVELLRCAKRPLVHVGQGVRLAGAIDGLFEFLHRARIPLVTARNANDLVDSWHELYVGRPGTFAQRGANFAVQACDVYVAIGTRLSLAQTGYNAKDYARRAKVVMVDVDRAELDKGTCRVDLKVQADAKAFLAELCWQTSVEAWPDWTAWLERCKAWQAKYPPVVPAQREGRYVNSYHLIEALGAAARPDDVIVTDMGFAFQNTHQAWPVKAGQRLMTNCGLAAMGWGAPAAIGAAVGSGRRVLCVTGDGGFMFTSQELSTARHHRLPIKFFLLNNHGYLTMRQSQENAFGREMGAGFADLSFPDFEKLADAHGVWHVPMDRPADVERVVRRALATDGPVLCEVRMDPEQPQVPKSVNRRDEAGNIHQTAIEDAWPYLPREELEENLNV